MYKNPRKIFGVLSATGITLVLFFLLSHTVYAEQTALGFGEAIAEFSGGPAGGVADTIAGFFGNVAAGPIALVLWLLKSLASFLLGVSGMLLNTAIEYSLNTANFKGAGLGASINAGWVIIRDLINMSFIFIVLYIAIQNILNLQMAGDKRVLGRLVAAALFINFSKFIASFVFDIGNLFALGFHKVLSAGAGLSGTLAENLRLISVLEYDPLSSLGQAQFLLQESVVFIILLVVALVFLYAAILFIGRTLMIVFLLMTSPIAFAGMILPAFKQYQDNWWKELIGQSSVAPIFLFFMFVLVRITNQYAFVLSDPELEGNLIAVFFNFAIIVGFLIIAIKETKKRSGQVGDLAIKAAGIVGGLALGGAALAGRAVIGRGASAIARSGIGKRLQNASESDNWAKRMGSRATMARLTGAQKRSFDFRQTKLGGTAMKEIQTQTGIDASGHRAEGGYLGAMDRREKKQKKRTDSYEKAGFDKEAERLKKDPGMVASAAKAVFKEERWANNPWLRAMFKGQLSQDRLEQKKQKDREKRQKRQEFGVQISGLRAAERAVMDGKPIQVELKITEEPGKDRKYEVVNAPPGKIPQGTREEKDTTTGVVTKFVALHDRDEFLRETRMGIADLEEQRFEGRQPPKKDKDDDSKDKEDKK